VKAKIKERNRSLWVCDREWESWRRKEQTL